jgi:hypothetical protein
MRLGPRQTPIVIVVAFVALIALLAIPALAASPSPTPAGSAAATAKPERTDKPDKAPKSEKAKTPSVAVTFSGTVAGRTDAAGNPEYTLTVGSTTYTLDGGPSWYWKDKNPLRAYVGKRVTVVGEQRQGSTEVDVKTVDGKALREPGKPPWAGGWKVVGKDHPGWSQEKADRWAAKIEEKKAKFGVDCWPPGHCKDASGKPKTPNPTTPAP